MELIRSFDALSRHDLTLAGGKGANLGAMVQAALPVPPGFVVLTHAYRAFVAGAGIQAEIERLALAADVDSQASLDAASALIRALFQQNSVPGEIAEAITRAYAELGGGAVAVRSSATAEDLPDASFAGQQETYLNINGAEQVVQAVRRCWSSLWTGRALAYRIKNGIAPGDVALAAVVQRLCAADVAGVLFTADPVSGRRDRMVIDGAWGLGESVVSGIVTPDNWAADGKTGTILREHVAAKAVMTVRTESGTEERPVPEDLRCKPVLNAAQVAALVDLGRRTAAFFGAPQDMEWAMAGGELYLLQSRPITTLYPLPEPAPPPGAGLRIYATFQGMQGVMEPLSPAAFSMFYSLVRRGGPAFLGLKPAPGAPSLITKAASRFYLDITGLLRFGPARTALSSNTIDGAMGQAVTDLLSRNEKRLNPASGGSGHPIKYVRKTLILTVAGRALRTLVSPDRSRQNTKRVVEAHIQALTDESRRLRTAPERVEYIHKALASLFGGVVARTVPVWLFSAVALSLAKKRLAAWGIDPARLDPVGRAVPHNPTTEMDLALWQVSRVLKLEGAQPRADHPAMQEWLNQYGHRAVREVDIAIPRWYEDPEHILQVVSTYMAQETGPNDPEHRFARGAAEAAEAIAGITGEVRRRKGALSAAFIRLLLRRFRQLSGVREWHKFYLVHMLSVIRQVLSQAGVDLVNAGRLDRVDDVFYLDFDDLTSDRDLRQLAAQNRAEYDRELKRRVVPLAMTSEGEVSYGVPPAEDGTLTGTGASAGVHAGVVRVILNPVGAQLEHGEILVAPGTDPAWTPLFLTAGALVTETGGMISHGSVVAREYGIPAVVGVPEATTRLRTGQRVRVDGSKGTVVPLD
ncbi:MAG TPA: PEP/pyruvate-binding domain-containing protein [Symbiobacteriaceae bacterium]|nr:PEP/pyruvate-binding domain-containing protein [Symbiobacteriaceae bacterium]